MASITKKIIRGNAYYYARECRRVEGRPKIVWQKYLGRLDDIVARASSPRPPATTARHAVVTDFGAVVALYDLARQLRIAEHIDHHVPKRGKGPSVGTYLLVAALNRCVAPRSKARIADWFERTVLRRLIDIDASQLTSQRFWDNMDRVSEKAIAAIEADLTTQMVRDFEVDISRVLFDATNFFTFIDTFNERSTLAQRGKSKEGRAALRIVGLALLVSADGHLPLLHRTYPGHQHDAPTFASLTEDLVARYRALSDGCQHVTLVFDKGNNSKDNLAAVENSPYHFVGSLVPTQHVDLLAIPIERFASLADDGLPKVLTHRTEKVVFGVRRTVLVTYNENLFVAQSQTLLREIAKRQNRLAELQAQLQRRISGEVRRGKRPSVASVRKKVQSILKARHMKTLFPFDVTEQAELPSLRYRFDTEAWETLQNTLLGKTILFTDNDDWSDAKIVRGYRSQHHVETAFRDMKDPHLIALRPQRHWTDQKVKVHVFICVLALLLLSLLRRQLAQRGAQFSIREMIEQLASIHEVAIVYPPTRTSDEPTMTWTLSEMTAEQKTLFDTLDLARYRRV